MTLTADTRPIAAAAPAAEEARRAIRRVLSTYLEALHEADAERMRSVLHPLALYATADADPPLFRDRATYLRVLDEREAPAGRGEPRSDAVDSIELAGANTARARVRCVFGGNSFVDFLSLVRVGGCWQIVAKVFQIGPGGTTDALR